jgi:type II secretory pathway pseudopilin PulG
MRRGKAGEGACTATAPTRELPPASPRRVIHRAFTLLELLVAMTMVIILATSLFMSLSVAYRARRTAEAAVVPMRTFGIALEILRQDFQNALPGGGTLSVSFEGTSNGNTDQVTFFTTADSPEHQAANGEIKMVQLNVGQIANSNQPALIRSVSRNLLAQYQVNPDQEILCRNVTQFKLRYSTGTQWVDTWDSTQMNNEVPAAVEVTVELAPPADNPKAAPAHIVQVFPLSCSNAALDPNMGGMNGGLP